jgi:protein-tyrosine-phosphatase/carbamoylphosphate synthase large subunit
MNTIFMKHYRALILDAEFPAALTILRSLSRQEIQCDIASSISKPISRYSRFNKRCFHYPDPLTNTQGFIDFIYELLKHNQYDLIIPVTERTLIPLSSSSLLDPWRDALAIANHTGLQKVLDKAQTMQLAQKCGVPVPYSHTIASPDEIEQLAPSLDYPVVIKPTQSIPNAKNRRQLSVSYAQNAEELLQICKPLLDSCQLLIQEYAHGVGTGVEILANHGEIVYAFQHKRIHELPLTGGGSTLRKSISVDPSLLDASKKMISALHWHGVAMVEFKWQPETERYWLMEINGRFWGSLPLAYSAGADFPKMLFDLWVLKQLPTSQYYNKGVYCRKLTSDLYWLEHVLRRSDTTGMVKYPSKKCIIKDGLLMFNPTQHFFDIQCWNDPIPGIIDLFSFFQAQYQRIYQQLRYQLRLRWHDSSPAHRLLLDKVKKAKCILFLCYGNINRSALSQCIAEQTLSSEIQFYSAGFHAVDKRSADPNMVEVAAKNGIDLANWQSTTLNKELIENCDLILAMEIAHLDRLHSEYPQTKNKAYLLGSLVNDTTGVEIPDPYNQSLEVYEQVFNQVKTSMLRFHTSNKAGK